MERKEAMKKLQDLHLVFVAFMVVTFCLALLMDPLWSLRQNEGTNNLLGMVGIAGLYSLLFNFNGKLSLFKVIILSVSAATLITYLDQAMGFSPGLYPITMIIGLVGAMFGILSLIEEDLVICLVSSIMWGVALYLILSRVDPWWIWYVDKYFVYLVPGYFVAIMAISLTIRHKGLANHIAQTA